MRRRFVKPAAMILSSILLSTTPLMATELANVEKESYIEENFNIIFESLEQNDDNSTLVLKVNNNPEWSNITKYVIRLDKAQITNLVSDQCEIVETDKYLYIAADTLQDITLKVSGISDIEAINYTGYAVKNDYTVAHFNSNGDILEDGYRVDLSVGLMMDFEHTDFNNIRALIQCIKLSTESEQALELSKVMVRYYFTLGEVSDMNAFCDSFGMKYEDDPWYKSVEASQVEASVINVSDNKYYLQIGFNGDTILSNDSQTEIQIRLSRADWDRIVDMEQFEYNDGVAIFYDGKLVDGVEAY